MGSNYNIAVRSGFSNGTIGCVVGLCLKLNHV